MKVVALGLACGLLTATQHATKLFGSLGACGVCGGPFNQCLHALCLRQFGRVPFQTPSGVCSMKTPNCLISFILNLLFSLF